MMEEKKEDLEFISIDTNETTSNFPPPSSTTSLNQDSSDSTASNQKEDQTGLLSDVGKAIRRAKHPMAAFFHLLFKGLALLVYFLGGFLSSSYVFIFVICILLLAFDFWTVKNVSGRLLVGLRWWNHIKEDGTNEWIFESLEDMREIDATDSRIFWSGLYGAPLIWVLFLIIGVLKFNIEWVLIVLIALTLSGANIIGYTKCKKDAKSKMQSMLSEGALGALNSSAGSTILSKLGGLAFGGGNSSSTSSVTV